MKIVVIPADADRPIEVRDIRHELHAMQAVVGGSIEAIYDHDYPSKIVVWVNENGKCERLPYNERATAFARDVTDLPPGDWVAGDAFVSAYAAGADLDPDLIAAFDAIAVVEAAETAAGVVRHVHEFRDLADGVLGCECGAVLVEPVVVILDWPTS